MKKANKPNIENGVFVCMAAGSRQLRVCFSIMMGNIMIVHFTENSYYMFHVYFENGYFI